MDIDLIKRIILEKQREVFDYQVQDRNVTFEESVCYVLVGPRRAGKSFLLYHDIQERVRTGKAKREDIIYLNFEDERISSIRASELGMLLDAYSQLFGEVKPLVYLDEIQNIIGWEKFARRLADSKYRVMITGSNAKMLSSEIATTLGGRYIPKDIFPFSFEEYLLYEGISLGRNWLYDSVILSKVARAFAKYLHSGGFAESFNLLNSREWLTSLYQKVLLGDVVERNGIRNSNALRLLVRKLADNVMQPCSLQRLRHIIVSSGESLSLPALKDYLSFMEEAYLMFSLPNLVSPFSERETIRKRYFMDNGILNLFLIDGETKLLENVVAVSLNVKYTNTKDETRLFYYNKNIEVDFCVPEDKLAIQVSYSIDSLATYDREVGGLVKFIKANPEYRGLIITMSDEREITEGNVSFQVLPAWKWLCTR